MQPLYFIAQNKPQTSSNYFYIVPNSMYFLLDGTPVTPPLGFVSIYISNNQYWHVIDCPDWVLVEVTEYYGTLENFIISVDKTTQARYGQVIFSSIYGDIILQIYQDA